MPYTCQYSENEGVGIKTSSLLFLSPLVSKCCAISCWAMGCWSLAPVGQLSLHLASGLPSLKGHIWDWAKAHTHNSGSLQLTAAAQSVAKHTLCLRELLWVVIPVGAEVEDVPQKSLLPALVSPSLRILKFHFCLALAHLSQVLSSTIPYLYLEYFCLSSQTVKTQSYLPLKI